MADYFMSITSKYDEISMDPDNRGTSSTAGDKIEFRVDQALTQRQALNGLARFKRWIEMNGLNGLGANLPADRG